MRRSAIGCVAVALIVALGPAAGTASAAKHIYRVIEGQFDVIDDGKFTGTEGATWNGNGHIHHKYTEDDELPALPVSLSKNKENTVGVSTELVTDGIETLTGADGKRDPCSKTWGDTTTGSFSADVKEKGGRKLQTTWEIPHGIATNECAFAYDRFGATYKAKETVDGQIGDGRLVLKAKGSDKKSESVITGTITQTLSWEGKIVLKKVKQPGPSGPTPFP